MRFSLFILGVFVAVVCAEGPAEAQNFNNVWPPRAGLAGTVGPIRCTSPHRDYIYRLSTGGAILLSDRGMRKSFGSLAKSNCAAAPSTECHKWVMPIAGLIGSALCSTKR